MDFIQESENDLKGLFNRFRKRNFSGTGGQAIKNSSYQLAQNLVFKFGSLIFTVLIARMLMPELFGLYSLALATIVLFGAFSDLGISSALTTFGSKYLEKKDYAKAKGYAKKLFSWKLRLLLITSLILIASSYFIGELFYQKPIFYALLVGAIYLPLIGLVGFIEALFKTSNNFKFPFLKEIIFQSARLTIIPLAILLFLNTGLSDNIMVVIILLTMSLSYSIALLFLLLTTKKKIGFFKYKPKELKNKEIEELKKFLYPLSAMALAGLFFGYVDTLMLGHFVSSEFIAYYGVAFSLVGGAASIIGFSAAALMPIFARKSGKELETIFKKTRNFTFLISFLAGIFTYFIADYIIKLAYGVEYLAAVPILKYFSILVFLLPLIGIYEGYFVIQKKTKVLAWLILVSAILNIIFNYFGITYGLNNFGETGAVFGAVFATILSRGLYWAGIVGFRVK